MELFAHLVKLDMDSDNMECDLGDDGESPRENFDNFFHAFVSIFVVLVGDDWQFIYYHASRCQGPVATVYFITLLVFGNFILLNLFLAILLGEFQEQADEAKIEKRKKLTETKTSDYMESLKTSDLHTVLKQMSLIHLKAKGTSLFLFRRTNRFRQI
jgi:hypothetical protein